jgi:hypothetical protein
VDPKDVKRILESVGNATDRGTYSLYLSRAIMDAFRKACQDARPSRVIESLMQQFVEAAAKKD